MILGFTDIGPDMQSAVGASYVIFLTDCTAYGNSVVSTVRVTHTKTCWRNKMIVTLWIFQRVWSFGGLARWLGTCCTAEWQQPMVWTRDHFWKGTDLSKRCGNISRHSKQCFLPYILDRHTTAVIGSLRTPQQSPMILFGKTYWNSKMYRLLCR